MAEVKTRDFFKASSLSIQNMTVRCSPATTVVGLAVARNRTLSAWEGKASKATDAAKIAEIK